MPSDPPVLAAGQASVLDEEFPGCRPFHLSREALATYDGRYEFWDGATQTAWQVRDAPTGLHELPSSRLLALAMAICQEAGMHMTGLGTVALVERDAGGKSLTAARADQVIYVAPELGTLPHGTFNIGADRFPDMVFEVDLTTDVRAGKLARYQAWGFPEVWVEVPDRLSRNRRPGMHAGLTIYLLDPSGSYSSAASSRAFPGWTAQEIHRALNEERISHATMRVLRRVGRVLGQRAGTGPDDEPWLGLHREEARAQGRAEGLAQGQAEGLAQGQAEGLAQGQAEGLAQGRGHLIAALIEAAYGSGAWSDLGLGPQDFSGIADDDLLNAINNCPTVDDLRAALRRIRA